MGDTVTLTLPSVNSNTTYYLKVEGPRAMSSHRRLLPWPPCRRPQHGRRRNARPGHAGPYQSLSQNEIATLFTDPNNVL